MNTLHRVRGRTLLGVFFVGGACGAVLQTFWLAGYYACHARVGW